MKPDLSDFVRFVHWAPMSEWSDTDPRERVGKRAAVAICVDGKIFGGSIDVKHTYSVFLHPNHLDKKIIGPDDTWPNGWRWVFTPGIRRGL